MIEAEIVRCERFDISIINQIIGLWKDSVVATHHFLSNDDILKLVPFVEQGVQEVEFFLLSYSDGILSAFIGIHDQKIEMLFVAPSCFKKGIGKTLITTAINEYDAIYVDVNEQNTGALNFYEHLGFRVYERQELDDFDNPFPILKMRLE